MAELNLDTFGEIMDKVLEENEIQMLITLPKGKLEPTVETNFLDSSVIWFYILLNTIPAVFEIMRKEMGGFTDEEKMVDAILEMVKAGILEDKKREGKDK